MLVFDERRVCSDDPEMLVRNVTTGHVGAMMSLPGVYDEGCYEEVARSVYEAGVSARERERLYKAEVRRLIRERYDADDEMAVLRQRDSKPEEFAEYDRFAEECKVRARIRVDEVDEVGSRK